MGEPLRAGAVAAMGLVATYCLLRSVVRAGDSPAHDTGVARWHLVMSVVMLVMLVSPIQATASVSLVAIFAVGAGWAASRLRRGTVRAASARLLLGCATMAAMLAPSGASAASPDSAMPGMDSASMTSPWFVLGMSVATAVLVITAVPAVVRQRAGSLAARLGACCELLMGLAMMAMVLPVFGAGG